MSSLAYSGLIPAAPPLRPRSDLLQSSFPALEAASPTRAVLLVPDANLYLAYRTLRLFRDAGIAVDLLCPRGHPLKHSRYVRHVCEAADWAAVEARVTAFLGLPQRPWQQIMVAYEPSVRRLLTSLDDAALAAWQPGALDPIAREFLLGKFGLVAAQAPWDLPIPSTRICANAAELHAFAAEIGGPVIVKPPAQCGGAGIRQFNNPGELAAGLNTVKFPLLAQQFILGRRVVLDLLCARGRLLAWLSSYSLAQAQGPFSFSTGRWFRAMPALGPLVEKIATRTRFEGFCGIDCIEEAGSGRIYLLEFNPRLMSGFRSARLCGVDCAPALNAWLDGAPPSPGPAQLPAACDVPVYYFPTDLVRCLRQRDWRGLQPWLPGARAHRDFCLDDLGVLLAWSGARLCKSASKG